MSPIAAIDLGGSLIRTGWWEDGGWLSTSRARSLTDRGEAGLIAQILEEVRSGPAASHLVLATAGMLDPETGRVHRAANLPLRGTDLRGILQEALGIPVVVVGDAVAATVAEFTVGAARGVDNGAYVTASTGIGLGMVIHGGLVRGALHQAGELGHIPVDLAPDAPACQCGQRGCLELYSSGSGLAARYAELNPDADPLAAPEIFALAEAGDPVASAVTSKGALLFGAALAIVLRLLSPGAVVIGGGLAGSSYYLGLVADELDRILADSLPDASRVLKPAATEPSNALVGAALVAENGPVVRRLLHNTGFDTQMEVLR